MSTLFDDPEMQEIFEGYLVETTELIDAISIDLMELESSGEDLELLNRIFRSFHTIKGTSAFMAFDNIVGITHHAEDLLNKLRKQELFVNQSIIDVLLEVHDWIETLVNNLQQGINEKVDYQSTIDQIELIRKQDPSSEISPETDSPVPTSEVNEDITTSLPDPFEEPVYGEDSAYNKILTDTELTTKPGYFSDDELDLIQSAFEELNKNFNASTNLDFPGTKTDVAEDKPANEITIEDDIFPLASTPEPEIEIIPVPEPEPVLIESSIPEQVVAKPVPTAAAKPQQSTQAGHPKTSNETIRVDVERVESLLDLSGELVLGRNRLAQLTEALDYELGTNTRVRELIETTAQIDFITSEIQSAVMKMRMVPISKLYQKSPRIVRDLSKEFGKKINIILSGEETEIDRGIIEELNDPLVHMIRNSCDHGIESPEERMKVGKTAEGTIHLDADQEGNNIVLRISDDGKGMDPEKLKLKAVEKGIITEEQASQMTRRDAFQLVFLPGFSTAVKVSNVSGRGVGMDVVRTNIQKIKGIIEIDSELGKGTTFTIKLPLTLAIIQGLLIKIGVEIYAIPLSSVIEIVSINTQHVYKVNQREVIRIREDVMPLVRLDKVLKHKIIDHSATSPYVVIVAIGTKKVGFVVDELLGQQEIVIKSLGEYLGNIPGIAGSTILGDGSVIMIIDVGELIDLETTRRQTD